MKKSKLIIMAVAAMVSQLNGVQSASAQEFFKVFVSTVAISTNQSGDLTYHEFGNRDLIRNCANDQGITNLDGLSLVYDRTADAVKVVSGTNDTLVCTPLTFAGGTSLTNTNGTKIERLSWVFWETNQTANGTLAATERLAFGPTNQLEFFSLRGQLQFATPASGTNGPVIYRGSIVAGSDLFDEFDGDDSHSESASSRHRD